MTALRTCGIVETAMHRMEMERGAGHLALGVTLSGPCHHEYLDRSLESLGSRHPLLSARLVHGADGGLSFHRGSDPHSAFSDGPKPLGVAIERELNHPFTAESSALLRMTVYPPDEDDRWALVISAHHAVADGRAMQIVLDELLHSYELLLDGHSIQYVAEVVPDPVDMLIGEKLHVGVDEALRILTETLVDIDEGEPRAVLGRPAAATRVAAASVANGAVAASRGAPHFSHIAVSVSRMLQRIVPWPDDAVLDCGVTIDLRSRLRAFGVGRDSVGAFHSGVIGKVDLGCTAPAAASVLADEVRSAHARHHPELGALCQSAAVDLLLSGDLTIPPLTVAYVGRSRTDRLTHVRVDDIGGGIGLHALGGASLYVGRMNERTFVTLAYPEYLDEALRDRGLPEMSVELGAAVSS